MLYNLLYAILKTYKDYSCAPIEKDSWPFHILKTCRSVTQQISFLHAMWKNQGKIKVVGWEAELSEGKPKLLGVYPSLVSRNQTLKALAIF